MLPTKIKHLFLICLFLASSVGYVNAQSAAAQTAGASAAAAGAAGYLGLSLDKQLPSNGDLNFTPSKPKANVAPAVKSVDSNSFYLKKITFSGFKKVPFSELEMQVQGYINQNVSISSVDKISSELTEYINSKGYLVQVFAPPQEVKDGVLKLDITQANLGGVYFSNQDDATPLEKNPTSLNRAQARAASYIYNQIAPGSVIDLKALDKALIILNDQTRTTYTGTLKQGLDEGQTDVGLQAVAGNPVIGNVEVNNYGVQSTGRAQAAAQIAIRDIFNLEENFSLGAIASEGTSFFKAGYAMPLASNGLRMAIDVNALNYKTISSAATPATGNSQSESLQFSYPVIASKNGITRVYAGASNRSFVNNSYGELVSAYSLKTGNIGMGGSFYGSMIVPTVDVFNLNLLSGSMYANTSPTTYQSSSCSSTTNCTKYVPNNYTKLNAIYSKSFFFNDQSNFRLAASGQLASVNLNSAENFYVSGPDGVRAYMPSVAYGSQGYMINADYNYEFKTGMGVGAFFDYAAVTQYKSAVTKSMINTSTAPNSYNISGAGVKASYKYKDVASVTAYVAKPLDSVNFPSLLTTGGKPSYIMGVQGKFNF